MVRMEIDSKLTEKFRLNFSSCFHSSSKNKKSISYHHWSWLMLPVCELRLPSFTRLKITLCMGLSLVLKHFKIVKLMILAADSIIYPSEMVGCT